MLSSSVIDKLESEGAGALAYHYFSFRDAATQDIRQLKHSLLMQITRCLAKEHQARPGYLYIPKAFEELYQKYRHSKSQFPLDEDIEVALRGLFSESRQTFVVLDALDECPRQVDQRAVLKLVESLCLASNGTAHILVTTRREPPIEAAINELRIPKTSVVMAVDKVNEDIKKFIIGSMGRHPYKRWPATLKKKVAKALVSKADGVFRWAALQLESLQDKERDKDVEDSLKILPKDLEDTYARILARIELQGRSDMAAHILWWLAYSRRPIKLSEVAEIAIFEMQPTSEIENDGDYTVSYHPKNRFPSIWSVRKILLGLITVSGLDDCSEVSEGQDGTVAFSHFTVQEYLRSSAVNLEMFRLDERWAHGYIMKSCLAYISCYQDLRFGATRSSASSLSTASDRNQSDSASISDSDSEYNFTDSEEDEDKGQQDFVPFRLLRYAVKYWWNHAAVLLRGTDLKSRTAESRMVVDSIDAVAGIILQWSISVALASKDLGQAAMRSTLADTLARHNVNLGDSKHNPYWTHADIEDDASLTEVTGSGNEVLVRLFIDAGLPINSHAFGFFPLHTAIQLKHSDVTQLLLQQGAELRRVDRMGKSPLSIAVEAGSTELVRELLDKGADLYCDRAILPTTAPRWPEMKNYSPLWVFSGTYRPLSGNLSTCCKPLEYAIERWSTDITILLVQRGVNILRRDMWGSCPLSVAVARQQVEVIQAMVASDPEACRTGTFGSGWTALHLAAAYRSVDIIKHILQVVDDLEKRSADGHSSLDLAVIGVHKLGKEMIESKSVTEGRDIDNGRNLPSQFRAGAVSEVITLLLRHGASLDATNSLGNTALHHAALYGELESVEVLLSCGADLHARNNLGQTPLIANSARNGNVDIVRALLTGGADINTFENNGMSALIHASKAGQYNVAEVLLEAGADKSIQDESGKTALDWATAKDDQSMIRLLCDGAVA